MFDRNCVMTPDEPADTAGLSRHAVARIGVDPSIGIARRAYLRIHPPASKYDTQAFEIARRYSALRSWGHGPISAAHIAPHWDFWSAMCARVGVDGYGGQHDATIGAGAVADLMQRREWRGYRDPCSPICLHPDHARTSTMATIGDGDRGALATDTWVDG